MKCKKCGAEIDGDSRYCEVCGTKQSHKTKIRWWAVSTVVVCFAVALLLVLLLPSRCMSEAKVKDVEVVDTMTVDGSGSVSSVNNTTQTNVADGQVVEASAKEGKEPAEKEPSSKSEAVDNDGMWVDLGLDSGTKWKSVNERGLYDYDGAVGKFGSRLPTEAQWGELIETCKWTWTGRGYNVTGSNGKSINLPANGWRVCNGGVIDVGSYGGYWTNASGMCIGFESSGMGLGYDDNCAGHSVRLVKN